jgi:hypothetical protein
VGKIVVKILLAILLIGSILKMPDGYFQPVRIACYCGFLYLAWNEFDHERILTAIIFVGLTIFLNPVVVVPLPERQLIKINLLIGLFLLLWVAFDYTKGRYISKGN